MDKDEFRYHTPQQAGVVHHPAGFLGNLGRSFQVYNWVGQIATHGMPNTGLTSPVAGYRVTEDPQFKGDVQMMHAAISAGSESPGQSAEVIRRYQRHRQIKQQIELDDSWVAPIVAGVLDPINLIPVPGMLGQGVVRGALRGGVGVGATGALSEGLRTHLDPSATKTEAAVHMGAAVMLGVGMGATLGRFKHVPKRIRESDPVGRAGRSYDNAIQGGQEMLGEGEFHATGDDAVIRAEGLKRRTGEVPDEPPPEFVGPVKPQPGEKMRRFKSPSMADPNMRYLYRLKQEAKTLKRRIEEGESGLEPSLNAVYKEIDAVKKAGVFPEPAIVDFDWKRRPTSSHPMADEPAFRGVELRQLPDGTVVVGLDKQQVKKAWDGLDVSKLPQEGRDGLGIKATNRDDYIREILPAGKYVPKTLDEFEQTLVRYKVYTHLNRTDQVGSEIDKFNKSMWDKAVLHARGKATGEVVKPRGYAAKNNWLDALRMKADDMEADRASMRAEIEKLKALRAAGTKTVKWTEGKDLNPNEIDAYLNSADKLSDDFRVKGEEPC